MNVSGIVLAVAPTRVQCSPARNFVGRLSELPPSAAFVYGVNNDTGWTPTAERRGSLGSGKLASRVKP